MSDPSPPTPLPRTGEGGKDPMRAAQANMRPASIKRFYRTVDVREADGGLHTLTLDGRGARTPGRNPLAATSRALMLKVAAEWERQRDTVDPADMPLTRLLNAAIDGVARTMAETRAEVLKYAGSDLICYRADEPEALAELQRRAFDPVLAWAAETLGGRFRLGAGVIHVRQPPESIEAIRSAIEDFDEPVALAGLSAMTTLSGSALLALAVAGGRLSPEEAWRATHVDEDFGIERWGADAEASARREARWREFEAAALAAALRTES
jgi:chaperone required for assembly of F1-ATPase